MLVSLVTPTTWVSSPLCFFTSGHELVRTEGQNMVYNYTMLSPSTVHTTASVAVLVSTLITESCVTLEVSIS